METISHSSPQQFRPRPVDDFRTSTVERVTTIEPNAIQLRESAVPSVLACVLRSRHVLSFCFVVMSFFRQDNGALGTGIVLCMCFGPTRKLQKNVNALCTDISPYPPNQGRTRRCRFHQRARGAEACIGGVGGLGLALGSGWVELRQGRIVQTSSPSIPISNLMTFLRGVL